jgi:hypothetical protein
MWMEISIQLVTQAVNCKKNVLLSWRRDIVRRARRRRAPVTEQQAVPDWLTEYAAQLLPGPAAVQGLYSQVTNGTSKISSISWYFSRQFVNVG